MIPSLAPILTVATIRSLEAANPTAGLMERVGRICASHAEKMCTDRGGPIVVLIGPGNNGGDALVAARELCKRCNDVEVVFAGDKATLPDDAAAAYRSFIATGGTTMTTPGPRRPALIIDGLFGLGLSRPPAAPWSDLIAWANHSGSPILSIDVPSGLDAATGHAFDPVIIAHTTLACIALKPGMLTGDGPDTCGTILVDAIGLDVESTPHGACLAWPGMAAALPTVLARRVRNVNKGTFGTLGILGGTEGMGGALILAGRAALRTGAGKVWLGFLMPDPPKLDTGMPELMLRHAGVVIDANPDALVIGPGLGTSEAARSLLTRTLALPIPIALDADALNLLARDAAMQTLVAQRAAPTLATPHPGEAARVLGISTDDVQRDRIGAAHALAHRLRASIVLKGVGSVIVHRDASWAINTSGGPALATPGSGDVLCGLLGALLAQGIPAHEALPLAVCLHGAAADHLVANGIGPLGLTASELPDAARALLNAATRHPSGA
ncbi:MAG: NAD(P)H-hydrate dehydratase [Betaproteobacteria bacterium]